MSRSSGVNPKNIQKNSADNLFKIRFLRDSVVTRTRGEVRHCYFYFSARLAAPEVLTLAEICSFLPVSPVRYIRS